MVGPNTPGRPVGYGTLTGDVRGRPGESSRPLPLLLGLSEKWYDVFNAPPQTPQRPVGGRDGN